jgi:hypothetical protein
MACSSTSMPSILRAVLEPLLEHGPPCLHTDSLLGYSNRMLSSLLHTSPVKLMEQYAPWLASRKPDWYSRARHLRYYNHAAVQTARSPPVPSRNEQGRRTMRRFEFLTAVTMKCAPCSLEWARRFGGTYRLSLQGRRISQTRNQLYMFLRNGGPSLSLWTTWR